MLTGKAKEDFEKWYNGTIGKEISVGYLSMYTLHSSMINALIIDWLDSVDIYVQIDLENIDGVFSSYVFFKKVLGSSDKNSNSRQEATAEAIKKANEIYNNLKKQNMENKNLCEISLRDYFASNAMLAVMQETQEMKIGSFWDWCKQLMTTYLHFTFLTVKYVKVDNVYQEAAKRAYEYADALLLERQS